MDRTFQKLYEIVKEEVLKNAHGMAVANKMVPCSGTRHKLPLKGRDVEIVYYPAKSENQPLIVGYHGGGFVFGGCALDDAMWKAVTEALDVNVASVGYRMSPDYQWKETLDDSYEALLYLSSHAEDFGFDGAHLSVMGASAGGNLAAAVSLLVNREQSVKLDNVVLLYPFLDVFTDPQEKGPGSLEGPICYVMNDLHCSEDVRKDPLVSPIYATSDMLSGLPNTILNYCEDDNLRKEAVQYGEMLKAAKVPVSEILSKGMPHAYFESGFKKPTEFEISNLLGKNGPQIIEDGSLFRAARECLEFIKENFVR